MGSRRFAISSKIGWNSGASRGRSLMFVYSWMPRAPSCEIEARAERDEAVGMLLHELGEPVVDHARHVRRLVRPGERLDRRLGQRQDLAQVVPRIHRAEARVEIVDMRDRLHALPHVLEARADVDVGVVERFRIEVVENVDFHDAN
jgi:hypothetical protein